MFRLRTSIDVDQRVVNSQDFLESVERFEDTLKDLRESGHSDEASVFSFQSLYVDIRANTESLLHLMKYEIKLAEVLLGGSEALNADHNLWVTCSQPIRNVHVPRYIIDSNMVRRPMFLFVANECPPGSMQFILDHKWVMWQDMNEWLEQDHVRLDMVKILFSSSFVQSITRNGNSNIVLDSILYFWAAKKTPESCELIDIFHECCPEYVVVSESFRLIDTLPWCEHCMVKIMPQIKGVDFYTYPPSYAKTVMKTLMRKAYFELTPGLLANGYMFELLDFCIVNAVITNEEYVAFAAKCQPIITSRIIKHKMTPPVLSFLTYLKNVKRTHPQLMASEIIKLMDAYKLKVPFDSLRCLGVDGLVKFMWTQHREYVNVSAQDLTTANLELYPDLIRSANFDEVANKEDRYWSAWEVAGSSRLINLVKVTSKNKTFDKVSNEITEWLLEEHLNYVFENCELQRVARERGRRYAPLYAIVEDTLKTVVLLGHGDRRCPLSILDQEVVKTIMRLVFQ